MSLLQACCRNIPILVDAEMGEEGFDKLLNMANYAVCSAKYPQVNTAFLMAATSLLRHAEILFISQEMYSCLEMTP